MNSFLRLVAGAAFTSLAVLASATENTISPYAVLAISAADDLAVVRTPKGEMITLKAGAVVPELNAEVVQVLGDKIVLKETSGLGDTLWLYKAQGNVSRVQRISVKAEDELLNQRIAVTQKDKAEKQ